MRIVYPIPVEKWIVRVSGGRKRPLGRRRSPKRGRVEDLFQQLVSVPALLAHPHFSLEIVLTREEELRRHRPGRAWRRNGWVVVERRLLDVAARRLIRDPGDLAAMLPDGLPALFTTADLAQRLGMTRDLAQKMAYCLRRLGVVDAAARRGNALVYRLTPDAALSRSASDTLTARQTPLHRTAP